MIRDSQRSKVYKAEQSLPWWKDVDRLETMEELQGWVDQLWQHRWLRRQFPSAPRRVEVRDGRRRRFACAGTRTIWMPRWSRSKMIVLHELAHVCEGSESSRLRLITAWHGREFCAAYLALVQHYLGAEKATELRAAFKAHRVRFRPKRRGSRPGNPAALAAWRARVAAALPEEVPSA